MHDEPHFAWKYFLFLYLSGLFCRWNINRRPPKFRSQSAYLSYIIEITRGVSLVTYWGIGNEVVTVWRERLACCSYKRTTHTNHLSVIQGPHSCMFWLWHGRDLYRCCIQLVEYFYCCTFRYQHYCNEYFFTGRKTEARVWVFFAFIHELRNLQDLLPPTPSNHTHSTRCSITR